MAKKSSDQKQKELQKQIDEAKKKYINWYDVVYKKSKPISR